MTAAPPPAAAYPLTWPTGRPRTALKVPSFAALPPPRSNGRWWEVLGVAAHAPTVEVQAAYRQAMITAHPDRNGGDDAHAKELNRAYDEFRKERGL